MIYETAMVIKANTSDEEVLKFKAMVSQSITSNEGEVLVQDDWGPIRFAQATASKVEKGRYLYFVYKAHGPAVNKELERQMGISELLLKSLMVKVAEDEDAGKFVKNLKTPYSKVYRGSLVDNGDEDDEEGPDMDRERRRFSRKKSCWFTTREIKADWKDPNTYNWLVNEFGKISPNRVTGISRKHQRFVTSAIKRARQIGFASFINNRTARTL